MAQKTIAEEIADLEARITLLDKKITEHQMLSELEEGGNGSKFRTRFTNIEKIYSRRDVLNTRLQVLYRSVN